ncbi:hypothetical protein EDD41_2437 [Luteococcus japonicus]|uniref:Uncharacterized protein n=1 Tax=Luteococcus japonicus TaxID=33984 RepID=A0A3N1ZWE9_9ACTN|nr:hypothetical protein [Luteococcus japonicus]ROR55179.1 hypothetical protein EDD41_2437 [Luteococcus japonicus]
MIASQTCDVVQPNRELVSLLPIKTCDEAIFKEAKRGRISSTVAVDEIDGQFRVARLDQITSFAKVMVDGQPEIGLSGRSGSSAEARDLARRLGTYFSRFPIPDPARSSFEAIINQLRGDMRKAIRQRALDGVLEFRVMASPTWDSDRFRLRITAVTKASSLPPRDITGALAGSGRPEPSSEDVAHMQIADVYKALDQETDPHVRVLLWDRFADCLEGMAQPQGCVSSIEVEVLSEDEYKYSDWRRSESLNLEALSPVVPSSQE